MDEKENVRQEETEEQETDQRSKPKEEEKVEFINPNELYGRFT